MKVLFDQGTPMPLRRHLAEHSLDTAAERGWSDVDNGALIDKAELEGYEVLVTTDQNMRHQQNLGSGGWRWSSSFPLRGLAFNCARRRFARPSTGYDRENQEMSRSEDGGGTA